MQVFGRHPPHVRRGVAQIRRLLGQRGAGLFVQFDSDKRANHGVSLTCSVSCHIHGISGCACERVAPGLESIPVATEIRKARLTDVSAIHQLVNAFAKEELMLPLSIGDITERLRDFHMAEIDGRIVGVGAIHVTWDRLVELRSLAVLKETQGTGVGRALVEALLADARTLGATEVFTLTYVPGYFEKLGFHTIDRADLPHKVWQDCTKCTKFPDCGEIAMKMELD